MKFNKAKMRKPVVNLAGGNAYKQDDKLQIISLVLSSFLEDKFYETGAKQQERLEKLCQSIDPLFLAKLSLYARVECGMRSVSHVMASWVGQLVKGQPWTKGYFQKIIHRPDDMLEIVSYTMQNFWPIPNAMKKGFAKVLENMKPYEMAKYKASGSEFKMVDLINLLHPKHTDTIRSLIDGTLKNTETWESKISASQGDEDKKKEAWKELLTEKKLGYMALVRNIRNILDQAPEMADELCAQLVNPEAIKKSLILPFRFMTALENFGRTNQKVVQALSRAVDISLGNMPEFKGTTLVVIDKSGSMQGRPAQIASLFGAVIGKKTMADIMLFSDRASYITYNPEDSVIGIATGKLGNYTSGWTSFPSVFQTINKHYDRIIILSDMQGWGHDRYDQMGAAMLKDYETKFGKTMLYSWDLAGHGSLMFPQQNVACLSGWSDKAIDLLSLIENGGDITKFIDSIEL